MRALAAVMVTSASVELEAVDRQMDWVVEHLSENSHPGTRDRVPRYMSDRGRPRQAIHIAEADGWLPMWLLLYRVYSGLYWETGETLAEVGPAVKELETMAETGVDTRGGLWQWAACAAGQFHALRHAWADARRWAQVLEEDSRPWTGEVRSRFSRACSTLIETIVALETGSGDLADLIRTLNGYHADGTASNHWVRDAATLVLARGYDQLGQPERALEATRRRVVEIALRNFYPTQLREEARLATALGRTTEAIDAYETYVALRSDPEPRVERYVEQARAALAELRSTLPGS